MDDIEKEIEKFDSLIDEEIAKLLLMEKEGKINRKKIRDIEEGDAALDVKIESIGKTYERKTIAVIGDESGHCILNLWEENKKILNYLGEGDCIRIANGKSKKGIYGIEINVGRFGAVELIERKIDTKIDFGERDGIFCLRGKLEKKLPTEVIIGENFEKFSKKIYVDGKEIYLFDERAKEAHKLEEGDEVILLWLYKRNGKIYADSFSRIIQKQHSGNHLYTSCNNSHKDKKI